MNVKLVENNVNSHDGSVKVVKVISQYKTLGITLTLDNTRRAMSPSHDEGGDEVTTVDNFDVVVFASAGILEAKIDGVVVTVVCIASKDAMVLIVLEFFTEELVD